jgi:Family of unknown function (DUF5996)
MTNLKHYEGLPGGDPWPSLPLGEWQDTYATLHMWTQIVGKIRLALAPMINHWWQVPLYVSCQGLTTSPIPYGQRRFQIDFDFIDHQLRIATGEGVSESFPLRPCSVAEFYREVMTKLRALGIEVRIWPMPVEIPDPIPFEDDHQHAAYDSAYVNRFWRILLQVERVLTEFRGRFIGKASPVHFFWGSFDLATTRFSGRAGPKRPGPPSTIEDEAYSHEQSSCGFWPGGNGIDEPAFYAYGYPEAPGAATAPLRPDAAFYSDKLREFILPYEAVRGSDAPDARLLDFLQTSYVATADRAGWDRAALERR